MGQQPAGEEKKEGVAEAAPKTPGLLPTTPALPPPKSRRKRWKLFEIDGYYRLRTDWFKNFHLGFLDKAGLGGAPFPRALGCNSNTPGSECGNSLSSTNMRLRLEPTINLDEGTAVHVQADVLDNLVLGSTPTGEDLSGVYNTSNPPPIGSFGNTQAPPVRGVNSDRDSIQIKRAWAEVAIPLGILKFGRQPNHWGMGMWNNSGGEDPIAGTYDLDADYGDSVDRVSFSAIIPGTDLRAMIASDWVATRLVSNQTAANKGREGHPWDLDDADNGNGWTLVISKLDSPQEFRDTIDRGDLAFNYGVYFEYKTQSWDTNLTDFALGGEFDGIHYVPRELKTYSPDVWAKLAYGRWMIEAEATAQLGSVQRLDDAGLTGKADIRKYGGVGRISWKGLEGKLKIGIEGGAASGDQWDNIPSGNTHIAYANLLGVAPGTTPDRRLTQFMFNREYKVDMILFRHLIGAVTNAAYGKPFLQYDITKSIGMKVANITSFALKPVATPGNGRMYGTEFNADLGYTSGGFNIGISYGVLFPFSAMSHPQDNLVTNAMYGFGVDPITGETNIGDPGTAHTIQTRMSLTF
ncbi:MAG: TIGR04551 family protein [Kofleriaceae bacterium]